MAFFLIQHLLGCCKLLTLLRSSGNVGSDRCCLFVSVCVEEQEFGAAHSAILLTSVLVDDLLLNFVFVSVPFSVQEMIQGACSEAFLLREMIAKTKQAYSRSLSTEK